MTPRGGNGERPLVEIRAPLWQRCFLRGFAVVWFGVGMWLSFIVVVTGAWAGLPILLLTVGCGGAFIRRLNGLGLFAFRDRLVVRGFRGSHQ